MQTAEQNQRNTDYYKGLVVKIGEMFGVEAKTQDDGGISEDVLCAKIPELVAKAVADAGRYRKLVAILVSRLGLSITFYPFIPHPQVIIRSSAGMELSMGVDFREALDKLEG